jgi:hypothetical protein
MKKNKIAKIAQAIKTFLLVLKPISEKEKIKNKILPKNKNVRIKFIFAHWSMLRKIGFKQK